VKVANTPSLNVGLLINCCKNFVFNNAKFYAKNSYFEDIFMANIKF